MKLVSVLFLACCSVFLLVSADLSSEYGPQVMRIGHEVLRELGYTGNLADHQAIFLYLFQKKLLNAFGTTTLERVFAELPHLKTLLTDEIERLGYTGPLNSSNDYVQAILKTGLHKVIFG